MDTTTNNQKIIIQTNDERIELEGQDLEVFNAQRVKDQLELDEQQAKINEIKTAKDSAIEKLSTLGLTEDEITALIS